MICIVLRLDQVVGYGGMIAAGLSLIIDRFGWVNPLANETTQVNVGILSNIMKLAVLLS
jgi:hypothetical protein